MTPASRVPALLPPHLSMDEYLEFVEAAIRECDPVLAARQKSLEERITKPFRITRATRDRRTPESYMSS